MFHDSGELPADVDDGVMFCTYQSLIAKNKQSEARLDQIVTWAAAATSGNGNGNGPEAFDGCLVFDEAHRAKNLVPAKGEHTAAKGSKTAEAVLGIQQRLPNARVVYVSATAAAETKDLGYMVSAMILLSLWLTHAGPSARLRTGQAHMHMHAHLPFALLILIRTAPDAAAASRYAWVCGARGVHSQNSDSSPQASNVRAWEPWNLSQWT